MSEQSAGINDSLEEGQALRVFVDSNILISALISSASVASQFLTVVLNEHRLVLCDYGITEVEQVIHRKFPKLLPQWELFLTALDFEMVHTPSDLAILAAPDIRDAKDRPILISALIAQPDVFVSGDQDFHSQEIAE